MNEFVQQCRREWKRLRVPDQVADEMAAELTADLREAEADGASVEEVLGSGASDPQSFAASWAAERGVVPAPRATARLPRTALVRAAIAALTLVTAIGAALVIFASPEAAAPTTAIRAPAEFRGAGLPASLTVAVAPPPPSVVSARPADGVWIQPDGRIVFLGEPEASGVEINEVGSILLIVGLVGVVPAMLFLLWSSRARRDYSF